MREWLWPPGIVAKLVILNGYWLIYAVVYSLVLSRWVTALEYAAFAAVIFGLSFLTMKQRHKLARRPVSALEIGIPPERP